MDFLRMAGDHFSRAHMEHMGTLKQDTAVQFATICALMSIAEDLRAIRAYLEAGEPCDSHPADEVERVSCPMCNCK